MEGEAGDAAKTAAECEECKLNPWKYKCPGCFRRTCSLPCVKAHKQSSGCTGKKAFNDVVPISGFDDNLLLSDYNMLEDVKRVAESARRMRNKICGYNQFRVPLSLKYLGIAASKRCTKLLFLRSGMTKRERNRTYYNYSKKFISWTVEWRFHSTDVVLMDHRVHEKTNLYSLMAKHLQPGPWKHPLKQFCDVPLDSLKLFIRKYHKGRKSPYRRLDLYSPLGQQLSKLVILEYPVIHVFLPSHKIDFEVINDIVPRQVKKPKELVKTDSPSHKGVTFKEEEVEDDDSSDSHVSDLAMHDDEEDIPTTSIMQKGIEEPKFSESVDGVRGVGGATQPLNVCSNTEDSEAVDLSFLDNMAFEFDPKLIESYPDLFAEAHADGYLNYEGPLTDEKYVNEGDWADYINGMPVEDELEEGEISS